MQRPSSASSSARALADAANAARTSSARAVAEAAARDDAAEQQRLLSRARRQTARAAAERVAREEQLLRDEQQLQVACVAAADAGDGAVAGRRAYSALEAVAQRLERGDRKSVV